MSHHISKESAMKLKELGMNQDKSLFYFQEVRMCEMSGCFTTKWPLDYKSELNSVYPRLAAPILSEIMDILSKHLIIEREVLELMIIKSSVWRFYYGNYKFPFTGENGDSITETAAKYVIYLAEQGLISF